MPLLIFIYSVICKYEPFQEVSLEYLIDGQTDDDSSEKLIGGLKLVVLQWDKKNNPFSIYISN